jgi:hypothetical protein
MGPLRTIARCAAATALPLALAATLAACSGKGKDEPTAADAGAQLQQAVRTLYNNQLIRGAPSVTSDAGSDQPCGEGKARRVYAATAPSRGFSDRASAFDYAVNAMRDIGHGWERQSTASSSDTVTSVGVDGHARISVVTSQDGKSYTISGQTDCLPTG